MASIANEGLHSAWKTAAPGNTIREILAAEREQSEAGVRVDASTDGSVGIHVGRLSSCGKCGTPGMGAEGISTPEWKCETKCLGFPLRSGNLKRMRYDMTIAQNMTIEEINMAPGTPGTHKKKNPIILIKKIKNKKEEGMIDRVRFPRQEGISFDRAERIPGWKRFESFTCRPGTLRGVCYRLTVARQFFQFALEQREKAHFASFFNRELVERHIEMIVADELAKAKTKANKLWALRYTLGWLENCLCLEDIRITGDGNIMGLRYLGALISAKVSQLHQQAKIDVSLSIQKEVMIDRQNYLDREQFSILGRKLIERLNVLEIALRTPSSNRTATAFAYRRTIFTAFFVLIPSSDCV